MDATHGPKRVRPGSLALTAALSLGAGALLAPPAYGDAVLHPGTITGSVNLAPNWDFCPGGSCSNTYGGFSVSNSSYSASTNFNGTNQFSLTIESDQTYNCYSANIYGYSPTYHYFSLSSCNGAIQLPLNGTTTLDLQRPGATIVGHVDVSGPGNLTQVWGYTNWYDSTTQESYYTQTSGTANDVQIPTVAGSNVGYQMNASIDVYDESNNYKCTVQRSWNDVANVASGATVTVTQTATVSLADCPDKFLVDGDIQVSSADGNQPYGGYIYTCGTGGCFFNWSLPAFTSGAPTHYELGPVPNGSYNTYLNLYFAWPANCTTEGGCLSYGNFFDADSYRSYSVNNSEVILDHLYTPGTPDNSLATLNQVLNVTGLWAGKWASKSASFGGTYCNADSTQCGSDQPSYGASASASVNRPADPNSDPAMFFELKRGRYSAGGLNVSFNDYVTVPPVNVYNYTSLPYQEFDVVAGQYITRDAVTHDTSEGRLVFDVIEPPGQTDPILISSPTVYASGYIDGKYVSINAYGFTNGEPTPAVRIVGPPGTYDFDAYASVFGSYARFTRGTLNLGGAVNTPAGLQVVITPTNPDGEALPLNLTFTEIVAGGDTSVSTSDVGPDAPGYTVLNAINGQPYLDVSTSATISGKVRLTLNYSPSQLGLNPDQEQQLAFLHYKCTPGPDPNNPNQGAVCAWEAINEVGGPGHSDSEPLYMGNNDPNFQNPNLTDINREGAIYHQLTGVTQSFSLFALGRRNNVVDPCANDTTPPELSIEVSPTTLWPVNHKMVPIPITKTASDNCTAANQIEVKCTAASNQSATGSGSGNTDPDIAWSGDSLSLRAERSAKAGARVYTISCTAKDLKGNTQDASATVTVPLSQGTATK